MHLFVVYIDLAIYTVKQQPLYAFNLIYIF